MPEEPETRELRESQGERERAEIDQAASADTEDEAAQHQRRADKAAYLQEKLEERAKSEHEVKNTDEGPDQDAAPDAD